MPKEEKGQSHSIRPVGRRSPTWCRYQPEEVEALVVKLAKEGNAPSRIGVILRDQHGIPLVKPIVGKSITQILKDNRMALTVPEDLEMLLRKARSLHLHLEKYKGDKHNKQSLQFVESKIRSLAEYYKRKGALAPDWKYTPGL